MKESKMKETQTTKIETEEWEREHSSTSSFCPPPGTVNKTITDGMSDRDVCGEKMGVYMSNKMQMIRLSV